MRVMMKTKLSDVKKAVSMKAGMNGSHPVTFTGWDRIFNAAKHGTMIFVQIYFESVPPRLIIYSLFVPGVSKNCANAENGQT